VFFPNDGGAQLQLLSVPLRKLSVSISIRIFVALTSPIHNWLPEIILIPSTMPPELNPEADIYGPLHQDIAIARKIALQRGQTIDYPPPSPALYCPPFRREAANSFPMDFNYDPSHISPLGAGQTDQAFRNGSPETHNQPSQQETLGLPLLQPDFAPHYTFPWEPEQTSNHTFPNRSYRASRGGSPTRHDVVSEHETSPMSLQNTQNDAKKKKKNNEVLAILIYHHFWHLLIRL
jgi:hypothetical protein